MAIIETWVTWVMLLVVASMIVWVVVSMITWLVKTDKRSFRSLTISLGVHLVALLTLYFLMSPASGNSEGDVIAIDFVSTSTDNEASSQQDNEKDLVPSAEEEESQQMPDTEKLAQEFEEALSNLADDADNAYSKKQSNMVAQKKRRVKKLKGRERAIAKNMTQRSRYGTLKPGTFYGVRVMARKVIFILDVSGSMDIREAKLQLKNAFHSMSTAESFNIIVYSEYIGSWQDRIVTATKANKRSADQWLETVKGGGGTDIYSALETAFATGKKREVETIYFLSDGLPTVRETNSLKILRQVRKWNQGIIINSIGIGPHQDKLFLEKLAGDNGGRYYIR